MTWALSHLRVEQAFRLLPELDALEPLRALMASVSRPRPGAEPHRTVGKRFIDTADLKSMVPRAVEHAAHHLASLYNAAITALESGQKGDSVTAANALLAAGEIEESAGHYRQAQAWYDHARQIAEELVDKSPEIEALRHIGRLRFVQGHYDQATRFLQRSLVLAEDVLDSRAAALACRGLGEIALERNEMQSASSWFARGLAHAGNDSALTASLRLGLSEVLLGRGQLDAADERLRQALVLCETIGNTRLAALCLDTAGRIESARGNHALALARHREALRKLAREGADPRFELRVRLNVCQLLLDWNRLPDAEDEIRRAEEIAIVHGLRRQLVWLYVLMGRLRARQRDDTGFVFFEKAIELCHGTDPLPYLEARVCAEYGKFHQQLDAPDDALACIERARELVRTCDDGVAIDAATPVCMETSDVAVR